MPWGEMMVVYVGGEMAVEGVGEMAVDGVGEMAVAITNPTHLF